MDYFKSLEAVDIKVLSPKVLVLLSKYARALRKHNGMVLKLNTENVFRDVHKSSMLAGDVTLQNIYSEILTEVNHQDSTQQTHKKPSQGFGYLHLTRGGQASFAT